MKTFLIISLATAIVFVSAEAPQPSSQYGTPAPSITFQYGAPPAPTYGAPAPAPQYGAPAPAPQYGAPAPAPQYGAPAPAPQYGAPAPAPQYGAPAPAPQYGAPAEGRVRKFVSVHVGGNDDVSDQVQTIRAGGPADTNYNIIFVKAPSGSSSQQTEVILPEQPHQKTLVYVLVRKPDSSSNIRVRGPSPTSPSKPEVYFIRYKNDQPKYGAPAAEYGAPPAAPTYGAPAPAPEYGAPPSSSYGTPSSLITL